MSTEASPPPRSPSPPSQTFHPSILPHSVPTPALVESVAGAAHYSGVRVDSDTQLKHHRTNSCHQSPAELNIDHRHVLDDLKELFCCRPTREIFDRSWNRDAVYEDPLSKCYGYAEYAAQWFALAKLCSQSETLSSRVMSSTSIPNRIVYHQVQEYTLRFLNRKKVCSVKFRRHALLIVVKTIESVVVVDLDENNKITYLVDQWGGNEMPSWFGASFLRAVNAKTAPWLFHVPKLST
ncbi:uncharacterized protein LACBIDRAFT_315907 [Laccaria bicolor S238N-H82]|uniref:Predicted protein n=1 Tax=Laccaria bicolor (strain S238N-H82 / ATCC MYA-4686) TaxID=486041 RepID=B0D3G4_LACBS|nr:uncharacterized protein LACBIDRAFT_315907 [Laccaria bicolor S238N-H82]EDR10915.1 predicted protein [Laccaria bicolor S238N-H82]|eukprot:XP_001878216.1 predicted protein [Laccaria bicolor S238N-H82]